MKGYILNDDQRLSYTEMELIKKGCTLYETLTWAKELDFVLLGFNGLNESLKGTSHGYYCHLDETFFEKLDPKTIVYTGKNNSVLNKLQEKYHFSLITLMKEEEIINKNATLTAEGTISEIIQKRPYTLENSTTCVIGYGHCGKSIANKLSALQSAILVIEKDPDAIEAAHKDGFEIISEDDLLKRPIDIIVNTAPHEAMQEETVKNLDKSIYLFDISSFPYGYHHECASHLHDYILPGLPSQYGYKEAGKMIADFIYRRGTEC